MKPRIQVAVAIAVCALFWSAFGLMLVKDVPLGLSWTVWSGGLAALAWGLSKWQNRPLTKIARVLLAACIGASALFSWREAPMLQFVNGLVVFLLAGLTLLSLADAKALLDRPVRFLAGLSTQLFSLVADVWNLAIGELPWTEWKGAKWAQLSRPVLRGLAILMPLLLLFGGLFASADAVFQRNMEDLLRFDVESIVGYSAWFIGLAYASGSLLYRSAMPQPKTVIEDGSFDPKPLHEAVAEPTSPTPPGGLTEVAIVLSGLNLLFLGFVAIQLAYLFGGSGQVHTAAGLTYSEYARRGFFELVSAISLALPLLMGCEAVVRRRRPAGWPVFRWLATGMAGLLAVVLASAIRRMDLYVAAYGLTELRFYVAAFLLLVGGVLGLLVLSQYWRRLPFALSAASLAVVMALGLNAANPDAFIASYNLARAERTGDLDADHLARLSLDAAPAIAEWHGKQTFKFASAVDATLSKQRQSLHNRDPRAWTWTAHVADRSLPRAQPVAKR